MCNSCKHPHNHTHGHHHEPHDEYNQHHGRHEHSHEHNHQHTHEEAEASFLTIYRRELFTGIFLLIGLISSHYRLFESFGAWSQIAELIYYFLILLPVGLPILREMVETWRSGSVMNEFTLMTGAAVGAFLIGEYPEGVAVLLFYSFGEKMEDTASDDVRRRIRNLVSKLPDSASVRTPDGIRKVRPSEVKKGDIVVVLPGERVPVDGLLLGEADRDFDTSAITGESVPRAFAPGSEVASGCIPVDRAVELSASRMFEDSSMTRILRLTEEAQAAKSPAETMLRRITRYYTPVVFILALLLFVIPWVVSICSGTSFEWMKWLRRSLVFLVCSCPCALVVSIPLSYFASLGNASRRGLLFKGSRFVDSLRNVDTFVFDKTGTLTTGSFHVSSVHPAPGVTEEELIGLVASLDASSTHPLARAIVEYSSAKDISLTPVSDIRIIPHGVAGIYDGKEVLAGSRSLMEAHSILVEKNPGEGSEVCVALDGKFIGAVYLLDSVRPEALKAISSLKRLKNKIIILSGDRPEAVKRVARELNADGFQAGMLPSGKKDFIDSMNKEGRKVAFIGDGINDAPAIAAAEVGVAMGTMGTDIAMQTADVVIASDNLNKLPEGVGLARKVHRVVVCNISFALGVKALVMILGAFGIASLWAAVFADTGVTLITILFSLLCLRK